MTPTELQAAVDAFKWYHEIDLGNGVKTKPAVHYTKSRDLIESGMSGMNLKSKFALDIGTRDGKYAFQAEKMGAHVLAIDNDISKAALWLKGHLGSSVDFRHANVSNMTPVLADVIFLFGVLYHLRYPMSVLRILSRCLKKGGKLHLETGMMDAHHDLPLLYCPVRINPYEQTSCSFFNLSGLTETL